MSESPTSAETTFCVTCQRLHVTGVFPGEICAVDEETEKQLAMDSGNSSRISVFSTSTTEGGSQLQGTQSLHFGAQDTRRSNEILMKAARQAACGLTDGRPGPRDIPWWGTPPKRPPAPGRLPEPVPATRPTRRSGTTADLSHTESAARDWFPRNNYRTCTSVHARATGLVGALPYNL